VSSGSGFCPLAQDVLAALVDRRDDVGVGHWVEHASSVSVSVGPAWQAQLGEVLADPCLGTSDGADQRADVGLVLGTEPEHM
jgi:hypothetical protein